MMYAKPLRFLIGAPILLILVIDLGCLKQSDRSAAKRSVDIPDRMDVQSVKFNSRALKNDDVAILSFTLDDDDVTLLYSVLDVRIPGLKHQKWDIFGSLTFVKHSGGEVTAAVYDLPADHFDDWRVVIGVSDPDKDVTEFYNCGSFKKLHTLLQEAQRKHVRNVK
ncbi:MAG: hypothetical protein JWM11_3263 [Planctomycetaceae bacterium]|nr:hypothetical protein [Planctomycetaceae bacterium]